MAKVTTVVNWVESLNCSVHGNPRWRLHTDDGTYTTSSDYDCNYNVRNDFGRDSVKVELSLTRAGRVKGYTIIPSSN